MFGTYRSHDSLPPTLVVTPAKRASASASRAYGGGRAPGPAMGRVKPEGDSGGWKRRCVHGRRCVALAAQCRGPRHHMPPVAALIDGSRSPGEEEPVAGALLRSVSRREGTR